MKRISLVFCLVLATAFPSVVLSQAKPAPALSELEQLKIENIQLKYDKAEYAKQALTTQEDTLKKQYQDLQAAVEKEYPGFTITYSPDNKPLLVLITPPAKSAPAKK